MENSHKAFIATLVATTLLTAGVTRAADSQKVDQQKATAKQTSADKDFSKISADGSSAFRDLTLTRLAIFDGQIDAAKKYVEKADTALRKATTDETVFTKAEADLKPPTSKSEPATSAVNGAAPVNNKPADQMKMPIAWLPVDGQMLIDEDYTANPKKTTAVADANKSLKSGDRKGAMDKLKLADINIDFMITVVPLEQTIKSRT
ncbi:MAG: YfdX family protein [Methylocella sp.]